MDVRDFLGLRSTHNPHRWVLPVVPGISTSANFLFGGCGLAACVAALDREQGIRDVIARYVERLEHRARRHPSRYLNWPLLGAARPPTAAP